jgi:hypothetical protein
MSQPTNKFSNLEKNEPQRPCGLQRRLEGPGTKQAVNGSNKFFFRLPYSYVSFFQAMAEAYYREGKIQAPSIGLLAKMCLITAGNAWDRSIFQLGSKENKINETLFPRKPWHPHAPTLQSTITLSDYSLAVEAALEADEEWRLAVEATQEVNAEPFPDDF